MDATLLGLTPTEGLVYEALLRCGASGGSELRRATKLSHSQVYMALDSLQAQGLLSYEQRAGGRIFVAADPQTMRPRAEERFKQTTALIEQLSKIPAREAETQTAIFEGVTGFQTAMRRMIADCPAKATVRIIGFSAQEYRNKQLAGILRDVNKRSKEKKHRFHMLLDNRDNPFAAERRREGITQLRFLPKGFKSPAAIDIFEDYVYILLWDERPCAIIIKNARIAQSFAAYFDALWLISKA